MKSIITGCALSFIISTPLLATEFPAGPSQPDWPPPGGMTARSAGNPEAYPARPVQAQAFAQRTFPRGYMPAYDPRYQAYRGEAPVLPPGADWPGTAYGYADMAPPPPPGYPVQVIPPPGIPLEGDIMDTTPRPVRHFRPQ